MSETSWKYALRALAIITAAYLVVAGDVEPTTAFAAAGGVAIGVTVPLPGRAPRRD